MKTKNAKIVIFADLDGTILDKKYDHSDTKPILRRLSSIDISVVLVSSKTRSEIEYYRAAFGIREPFIVENGSAIFIPEGYFQTKIESTRIVDGYGLIEFGVPYSIIREKLSRVRKKSGANIIGFGDMTVAEVAKETGMSKALAKLAKEREYDEAFKIIEGKERGVLRAIRGEGLCYTKGGKYFHALGNCDKGKAVSVLRELYLEDFSKVVTIGVGDSSNDLPMLKLVDKQFWVDGLSGSKEITRVWLDIEHLASDLKLVP